MASEVKEDRSSAFLADPERVTEALARSIRTAMLQHKRAGNPILVWRDGQIVWGPAEDISVDDVQASAGDF
jgi:hypothetical protein